MFRNLKKDGLKTVGDLQIAQGGTIFAPSAPQAKLPPLIDKAIGKNQLQRKDYDNFSGYIGNIYYIHLLFGDSDKSRLPRNGYSEYSCDGSVAEYLWDGGRFQCW